MFVFTSQGERIDRGRRRRDGFEPYVVPNPYVGSAELRAGALRGVRAAASGGSSSAACRPRCTIRIYNVRGELVQTLQHDGSNDGFVAWDLRTKDNLDVAPGLYIFHVDGGEAGHEHRQVRDHQVSARSMANMRRREQTG